MFSTHTTHMPAVKNGKIRKRSQKRGYKRYRSDTQVVPRTGMLPRVRSLNGWGIGFPQKLRVKLKYGDSFNVSSLLAGDTYYRIFAGNSIYDPDVTGTGHQPRYHDQLAELYTFYHVESCTMKFTCHPSTDQGSLLAFCIPDASAASAAIPFSAADVIEMPGGRWRHCAAENAGPQPTQLVMTKTTKEMQDETRETKTNLGSNPTDVWNFVVGCTNTGSVNSGLWATVELTYTVVLSELKEPTLS